MKATNAHSCAAAGSHSSTPVCAASGNAAISCAASFFLGESPPGVRESAARTGEHRGAEQGDAADRRCRALVAFALRYRRARMRIDPTACECDARQERQREPHDERRGRGECDVERVHDAAPLPPFDRR
jgi:hypothetical protein